MVDTADLVKMTEDLGVIVLVTISMLSLPPTIGLDASRKICPEDIVSKTAYCSRLQLTSIPTNLQSDLQILYLDSNLLTKLQSNSFSRYPALRQLNLTKNNISHIADGTFSPLTHLEVLSLTNNPVLPNLDGNLLSHPCLTYFEAKGSNLNNFPKDAFSWFNGGAEIHLSNNDILVFSWEATEEFLTSYINLSRNKFSAISNHTLVINSTTERLDMSFNPFQKIDSTTVSSLHVDELNIGGSIHTEREMVNLLVGVRRSTYIKSLRLTHTDFQNIPLSVFSNLLGKGLEYLDLSLGKIQVLLKAGLSGLDGVSNLTLNSNDIQSVEPEHFAGMSALRILSLVDNKISAINSNNSTWNVAVLEMDLSWNSLVEINRFTFKGLETLESLNLSNNENPVSLKKYSFSECPSLRILNLSRTRVIDVPANLGFSSLAVLNLASEYFPCELIFPGYLGKEAPVLERLELQDTSTGMSYLWNSARNMSITDGLNQLSWLDLSGNAIQFLPVGFFQNLSQLTVLHLQVCSLVTLNVGVFSDLRNLEILNLEHNLLQYIPQGIFDDLVNLVQLILSENYINSLSLHSFKYNRNVVLLDISSNNLPGLNYSTFKPLPSRLKLNISDNPLVCNCDLKWLHAWLKSSVELIDSSKTICLYSSGTLKPFRGKALITFDVGNRCVSPTLLYSCLVFIGVLVMIALPLLYYHRWWIRYRLFLVKLCLIGYNEILDDVGREEFEYDIAIMLHEADEEWVNQHLKPALRQRLPEFDRIVCGDGELKLGMYYLDAVDYAVGNSFKTIFIISVAALQDQWFITKFRIALDHVNDVGIEKMVLILLDDIKEDDLHFLIRLYLSDHRPYLLWNDDDIDEDYFWKELVKSLIVNTRCNHLVPP